ncbi:MAG: hypothetical protein JWM95_2762 [Gemmatimonadetes bacterium]|nr:hypothetical protein [Gemmatimonadota bacterium]
MQTVVPFRLFGLIVALLALFTGCARRPPSQEWIAEQIALYGSGGWTAVIYPRLRERPLAAASASGDTVVRLFETQSFAGTHVGRVERRKTGWMYVSKYQPESQDAAPVNVDSVLVAPALIDSLLSTIRAGNYWQYALTQCNRVQIDGQSVTLEARIGAKYYTVHCTRSRTAPLPRDVAETLDSFYLLASLLPDRPPPR